MTDQRSPKLGLGLRGRTELQQKLIMTPHVRRNMSDEEAEKRLFAPPKKKQGIKKTGFANLAHKLADRDNLVLPE